MHHLLHALFYGPLLSFGSVRIRFKAIFEKTNFWIFNFQLFNSSFFCFFFKMYFVHESDVFVFKTHHILHSLFYDHFQGFPPALGIQGLQKDMFLMILLFRFWGLFAFFIFGDFFDWWILEQMVNCHLGTDRALDGLPADPCGTPVAHRVRSWVG